ncbi:MAG: diaminopimelate epimerase [Candidatus Improbicoccus pseudotrichonymphae]|uniref:Diaminopimelate epimerase n=1 Tax=Candidatus Improbicoccus pseudotrichonymphae TaxID=3033792 RepID=A0AA48I3R4_9FIRM|nr:MAG: diaminopimelate epimerase [Candidatus Improbicoccus pseudotrichonymphae]
MIKFIKYQGCGNDYIYVDCSRILVEEPKELAIKISDRHYGVGSDGLILVFPSKDADAEIKIFNADGSEAEMCGNGIRCAAKYLYDKRKVNENISIKTISGIKKIKILNSRGKAFFIEVDMGRPVFEAEKIPFNLKFFHSDKKSNLENVIIDKKIEINGNFYSITCVSMGNPHCVIVLDEISDLNIEKIGSEIQNSKYFPESVNVEFVKIENKDTISMRVFERGSGETMSCGTGACASIAALTAQNIFEKNNKIKVRLKGGELFINHTSNNTILMSGYAERVFRGYYSIN